MLITNGRLVTWEGDIIEDGAIYVEDGKIAALGPTADLAAQYPDAEALDACGQLVMPGNICAHTHFYGAFSRGMAIPDTPPDGMREILDKLWWPLDRSLDLEAVLYSAFTCLIDAVKHGTTTVFDHHASPNALPGCLEVIAGAVRQTGIRAVLCYEVTDRDGPVKAEAGIKCNAIFAAHAAEHPMIAASFGLHASMTLSERTLAACVEAEKGTGTGFHLHVAESLADQYDSVDKYGKRVVERLADAGVLGPRTIAAHGVHCDPWELALLRETGTWVTHQPRSNMNNGVGSAPAEEMLRGGMKVGLGNDGFSNNMWAEWKAAYLSHKLEHRDPRRMPGDFVKRMAIDNNAALAAAFFPESPPGYLREGAAADIIFVDYDPPTPLTTDNLPWHILFGFESSMVTTTIAAGRVLMRDRELLTLDEAKIMAEARRAAEKVWKRYGDHFE